MEVTVMDHKDNHRTENAYYNGLMGAVGYRAKDLATKISSEVVHLEKQVFNAS